VWGNVDVLMVLMGICSKYERASIYSRKQNQCLNRLNHLRE
jgi:hypothetical protein